MWTTFEQKFSHYICVYIYHYIYKILYIKRTLRLGAFNIKDVTFLAESIQRKLHTNVYVNYIYII